MDLICFLGLKAIKPASLLIWYREGLAILALVFGVNEFDTLISQLLTLEALGHGSLRTRPGAP